MLKSYQKKSKWNRVLTTLLLTCTLGFISWGCSKDHEEYYVKYEINTKGVFQNSNVIVEYTADNEQITKIPLANINKPEIIIGPVRKGFKASLKITSESSFSILTQLSVSKNNGPFALKKSDNETSFKKFTLLEYLVD